MATGDRTTNDPEFKDKIGGKGDRHTSEKDYRPEGDKPAKGTGANQKEGASTHPEKTDK
jgi:hypothetical protein